MQPAKHRLDGGTSVGAVVLVLFVLWALARGIAAGTWLGGALAYLLSPLALGMGVWLGRSWLAGRGRREAELIIGALAAVLVLAMLTDPGAGGGPLGYANANAALAVQGAALAGVLAARTRSWAIGLIVGLVTLVGPLAFRSIGGAAAAVVVLPALVVAVVGASGRVSRWLAGLAALAGAALVSAVAVGVVWLAELERWPALASATLDEARRVMWSEALGMWRRAPVAGMGPGSFESVSSLASDPDTSTAHSSLLQVGAETGWIGVALLATVVLVGFWLAARAPGPAAVVSVAAWTALWTHSLVDHIVDFPAVVLVAGLVLGWAAAARPSEQLDVSHGEHP